MPLLAPPLPVEGAAAAVRTGWEWLATEPPAVTALLADLAGHVATEVDNHGPPAPVLTDVTTHDESSLGQACWRLESPAVSSAPGFLERYEEGSSSQAACLTAFGPHHRWPALLASVERRGPA